MYRNEQKLKDQHKRESRHVKDQTAYAYFEPQADQAQREANQTYGFRSCEDNQRDKAWR